MRIKILISASVGIILSLFFIISYLSSNSHAHYLVVNLFIWPVKLLTGVLFFGAIVGYYYPSVGKGILRRFMTPGGLVLAVSFMAALIGVLLISQDKLVMISGLIFDKNLLPAGYEHQGEGFGIGFSFLMIFFQSFVKISLLCLLIFAYRNIGKLVFRFFISKEEYSAHPEINTIISIALGLCIHGILLIKFSLIGYLNWFSAWLLLGLLLVVGFFSEWQRRDVIRILSEPIFEYDKKGEKKFYLANILFCVFVVWFGYNILHISRPTPIGWDDLSVYVNYGKNLFETGSLPYGLGMRFWEVFISQGFFLLNTGTNAELVILLSFMGVILTIVSLYLLARYFWPENKLLWILLPMIFYTTPMVFFEASKDQKTDIVLVFFFVALLSTLFSYWESIRHKLLDYKTELFFLSLMGLFVGISFSIKYTAGFFIVPVVIFMAWLIFNKQGVDLRMIILPIIFIIIPIAPWVIKGFWETRSFDLSLLSSWQRQGPQINIAEVLPSDSTIIGSAYNEEVLRYVGYESDEIGSYLLRPWKIHRGTGVNSSLTDIGYIWLAGLALFLPFLCFYKKSEIFSMIGWGAIIYWTLWIFMANSIPWYGMPGFVLLLLLFGYWYDQSEKVSNIISSFFIVVILLWICIASQSQFAEIFNPFVLGYASGHVDSINATKQMASWLVEISEKINSDSATLLQPKYVYRIGTMAPYFIKDSFSRVFSDSQLETFTPLYTEQDQRITTIRLIKLGFRYMIIDLKAATIDTTPGRTLTQKFNRLMKYVSDNPYIVARLYKPNAGILFIEIKDHVF